MPDRTLSGSSITMLQAVKNRFSHCDIELHETLNMATLYPAKLIGRVDATDKIESGYKANLVVLNKDLNLKKYFLMLK